jgi:GNAT superfamily N-acetyltransferase
MAVGIVSLNNFSRSEFSRIAKTFICEEYPELVDYLKKFAFSHHQEGLFQTYLFKDNDGIHKGYISFTITSVTQEKDEELREEINISKNMIYPIPALKITRLCVSKDWKKSGIGSILMDFALLLAYEQQLKIGCRIILVDSKQSAIEFYKSKGFQVLDAKEDIVPMFKEIEPLGSTSQIKASSDKKDMLKSFIEFSDIFNVNAIGQTFKELLTKLEDTKS